VGDYEIHTSAEGFSSIRQISSGEIMHSVNAPDEEANRLYVEQSRLAVRLMKHESETNELVIWDVGLGAGFNAMAVIHGFERTLAKPGGQALRRLCLVSFEWDLDPLRLALTNHSRFPHLRHGAPFHILQRGQWKHASNLLDWELLKVTSPTLSNQQKFRILSFTTRSRTKRTLGFGPLRRFRGFSIIASVSRRNSTPTQPRLRCA
jgi:queuine tRNA-ribosyltransferase